MSPSLHQLLSLILTFFSIAILSPTESRAQESRSWEGTVILARDTSRSSSRAYKRWLREQQRLERKIEREQAREAKRQARRGYSCGSDYYPVYRNGKNPVVSTDESYEGGYAPDGTYHSEEVTEDRHESYYSPGRQEAITSPNTLEDTWTYGDGTVKSRQKTSWIGADRKYHSTTINRTTQTDDEGNTHTDTHVDLKRQAASSSPDTTTSSQTAVSETAPSQPETSSSTTADTSSSAPAQASSSASSPSPDPTPKPTETEAETPSATPVVNQ